MMPLIFAEIDEVYVIKKIDLEESEKKRLGDLGFVVGAKLSVISSCSGDLVVSVRDSRIAISKKTAEGVII